MPLATRRTASSGLVRSGAACSFGFELVRVWRVYVMWVAALPGQMRDYALLLRGRTGVPENGKASPDSVAAATPATGHSPDFVIGAGPKGEMLAFAMK